MYSAVFPRQGMRFTSPQRRLSVCRRHGAKPDPATEFVDIDPKTVETLKQSGYSQAEAEAEAAWSLEDVDPDASVVDFEDIYKVDDKLPEDVRDELVAPQHGPPALLLAGFRIEEYAIVRAMLDQVGARHVKVLPCSSTLLYATQIEALTADEPKWEEPRGSEWLQGGAWGSKRVCMFSGLSIALQAVIVELLEGVGIDGVCPALALPQNDDRVVGELLAEAVKARVSSKSQKKTEPPAVNVDPEDRFADALPDLESILGKQAKARFQKLSERVANAESMEEVGDLNDDLTGDERRDLYEFLQGLSQESGAEGQNCEQEEPPAGPAPAETAAAPAAGSDAQGASSAGAGVKFARARPAGDRPAPRSLFSESSSLRGSLAVSSDAAARSRAPVDGAVASATAAETGGAVADGDGELSEEQERALAAAASAPQELVIPVGADAEADAPRGETAAAAAPRVPGASDEAEAGSDDDTAAAAAASEDSNADDDAFEGEELTEAQELALAAAYVRQETGIPIGVDWDVDAPDQVRGDIPEEQLQQLYELVQDLQQQIGNRRELQVQEAAVAGASVLDSSERMLAAERGELEGEELEQMEELYLMMATQFLLQHAASRMRDAEGELDDVDSDATPPAAPAAELRTLDLPRASVSESAAPEAAAASAMPSSGGQNALSAPTRLDVIVDDAISEEDLEATAVDAGDAPTQPAAAAAEPTVPASAAVASEAAPAIASSDASTPDASSDALPASSDDRATFGDAAAEEATQAGEQAAAARAPVAQSEPAATEPAASSGAAPPSAVPSPPAFVPSAVAQPAAAAAELDSIVDGDAAAPAPHSQAWLQDDPAARPKAEPRASRWTSAPPPPPVEPPTPPPAGPVAADEDATMDAITRAIKSGVDVETLKRYIDEVAQRVGPQAGSWVERAEPETSEPPSSGVLGSAGEPLQFGPRLPPRSNWDVREEIRAERAAAAAAIAGSGPPPASVETSKADEPTGSVDIRGESMSVLADRIESDVRLQDGAEAPRPQPYPKRDYVESGEPDETAEALFDPEMFAFDGEEGWGDDDTPVLRSAADLPEGYVGMNAGWVDDRDDAPQQVEWSSSDDEPEEYETRPVTRAQLEDIAKRHGLDLQELLDDAAAKGVRIE